MRLLVILLAACLLLLSACSRGSDELPIPAGALTLDLAVEGAMDVLRTGRIEPTQDDQAVLLGAGWHATRSEGPSAGWTWSASARSELLLPMGAPPFGATPPAGPARLLVAARAPAFLDAGPTLELWINGTSAGELTLERGIERYLLDVPAELFVSGLNRLEWLAPEPRSPLELGVGQDARPLGFEFGSLIVEGVEPRELRHKRLSIPKGAELELQGSETAASAARLLVQDADALDRQELVVLAAGETHDLAELAGLDMRLAWFDAEGPEPSLALSSASGYTHVILIVVDTLRYDALELVPTPNLDRIAAESSSFERCFAHAPITLPSHTSLFSSRLPHATGVVNNGLRVPRDLPMLTTALAARGQAGHGVISLGTLWHLGPGSGLDRGFASYQAATLYDSYAPETSALLDTLLPEFEPEQPLFLFAHFADPHEPYRGTNQDGSPGPFTRVLMDDTSIASVDAASAPYLELTLELEAGRHRLEFDSPGAEVGVRALELSGSDGAPLEPTYVAGGLNQIGERMLVEFELGQADVVRLWTWLADHPRNEERVWRYGQEVHLVDKAIGRLREGLLEAGIWDRSLVVFTSDHGEGLSQHGIVGHVEALFDEQLHVPLMVKLPKDAAWDPARQRLDANRERLVRHVDLVPTLVELLGLEPLEGAVGSSLLDPELATGPSRELLAETHTPQAPTDLYCLRDERWKLIYSPERDSFQMFDLAADPDELVDRSADSLGERPDWPGRLRALAADWELGEGQREAVSDARLEALGY